MIFALTPLIAEPIFHIGSFALTNAYLNSLLAVIFFLIIGLVLKNKTKMLPTGIQNAAEAVLEFMLGYIDRVTHDRQKSIRFFPIVGGLFLFILASNWFGILPISAIGRFMLVEGKQELVPIFRSANSDLNLTLAMALFAVAASHILGIATIGFFRYANKFIRLGELIKSLRKGPIGIFVAIAEFGVGLIEVVSEAAKIVSLSLRLFGNVFAGEVLLTVIAGLVAYLIPLPFMFLELLIGLIQALVFAMLTLTYLTVSTMEIAEEASH